MLRFELTFDKTSFVTDPDGNKHEIYVHCVNTIENPEPIKLGILPAFSLQSKGDLELFRRHTENRALLSAALVLLDAQFAIALSR